MVKRINKKQLEDLILGGFSALSFSSWCVRLNNDKLSHLALVNLCSLLWQKLQSHSSVINGANKLAPSFPWYSLKYRDLNCLVRVLLYDYCNLYSPDKYFPEISAAYIDTLPASPFASFLSTPKIEVDLNIQSYTRYIFGGKEYCNMSELLNAIYERYPVTKYKTNLIF